MQICNDADLGTEYSFPQNQNIMGQRIFLVGKLSFKRIA